MGVITQYGEDISNDAFKIYQAQFIDMRERRKDFIATYGKEPLFVRLPAPDSNAYVVISRMEEMEQRYDKYVRDHGVAPTYITPLPPVPTVVKGPIQTKLEAGLGVFTSFTQFYNKCKGRGYAYYYNDIYDQATTINRLINKMGVNCTDVTQLGFALAKEMGYEVRYIHVYCQSGAGHILMQIRGHEFANWTYVDLASAISVGSQYDIGDRWCSNPKQEFVSTESWLLSDDGRT